MDEVKANGTMPEHLEMSSGFVLPPLLDQSAAEFVCRVLHERLLAGQPLLVDGSAVVRPSTISLQVMVAAARSARAKSLRFELINPSAALAEALTQLGLQPALAS